MPQIPLDAFVDFTSAIYIVNGIAGSHRWADCMESIDLQIASRRAERIANRPAESDWRAVYF
jgi:hypothetical protein